MGVRYEPFTIKSCEFCGSQHQFFLKIQDTELLFGGPGAQPQLITVAFVCPNSQKLITVKIPEPPGGEILGSGNPPETTEPLSDEFGEWRKDSRSTATAFCVTMLSTSISAIPVYFAVTKYLGVLQTGARLIKLGCVVPPLLLLLSAIFFVMAIRPQLTVLRADEFTAFRARRLRQMNICLQVGTGLFMFAVLSGIVLLFVELLWSNASPHR